MSQIITVNDLIEEVRNQLDEDNVSAISDTKDILPALNRGQNFATNILSRHYESPLLTFKEVTPVSGQEQYQIPEDAFEQKLMAVELNMSGTWVPVARVQFRDSSKYETSNVSSYPSHYVVVNNNYKFLPVNNFTSNHRVWYLQDPMSLVTAQGRINTVNTAGNYVIVDAAGPDLTTESDQLDSYVNIIDAQTGLRKATFQVKNIVGNKILFKSSPARATVRNIPIDTDMSTLLENTDTSLPAVSIEPDDYICVIKGSCVPFYKKPNSSYIVQYAVAELQRKLGMPTDGERNVLKDLEQQVERSWAGREHSLRIRSVNIAWNRLSRYPFRGNNR